MALALWILFVLSAMSSCEACSCVFHHPQAMFCNSDFVVRAKVLARSRTGPETYSNVVYTLRIQKIFKGAATLNQTEGVRVYGSRERSLLAKAYTPVSDSLCGVNLAKNIVFLLTGHVQGQKLLIGLCDWIQGWSSLTRKQRIGLRKFYGENCDCKISLCYLHKCRSGQRKPMTCRYDSGINDCYRDHSYCIKNRSSNACSWRETAEYKNCTSQSLP